jgi:hypothetical protein
MEMLDTEIEIGMDTRQASVYSDRISKIYLINDEFSIAEIDHFPAQTFLHFKGKLVCQRLG